MVHDECPSRTLWVAYDLRDPDQWEQARQDREAWGKALATVHTLDLDHVLIMFHPGGASCESQAAA
jgi:hypothetical protein